MASKINMTELYFEWWLEDLKSIGLVLEYTREPKTFELHSALPIYYDQHYKTKKPIVKNFNLFRPITYTPDYKVVFSSKLLGKLFGIIDTNVLLDNGRTPQPGNIYQDILFFVASKTMELKDEGFELWFDVKPPSSALRFSVRLGSSREFPIKQRLMWEEHNIIVNKVVPNETSNCLFSKTFLPERYKWTDKSGAVRKLKTYESKAKSRDQYLSLKNI